MVNVAITEQKKVRHVSAPFQNDAPYSIVKRMPPDREGNGEEEENINSKNNSTRVIAVRFCVRDSVFHSESEYVLRVILCIRV